MRLRKYLFVTLSLIVGGCEDSEKVAGSKFVGAAELINTAAQSKSVVEKFDLLTRADAELSAIVRDHPGSAVATKIVSGERIGASDRLTIQRDLQALKSLASQCRAAPAPMCEGKIVGNWKNDEKDVLELSSDGSVRLTKGQGGQRTEGQWRATAPDRLNMTIALMGVSTSIDCKVGMFGDGVEFSECPFAKSFMRGVVDGDLEIKSGLPPGVWLLSNYDTPKLSDEVLAMSCARSFSIQQNDGSSVDYELNVEKYESDKVLSYYSVSSCKEISAGIIRCDVNTDSGGTISLSTTEDLLYEYSKDETSFIFESRTKPSGNSTKLRLFQCPIALERALKFTRSALAGTITPDLGRSRKLQELHAALSSGTPENDPSLADLVAAAKHLAAFRAEIAKP
jgi:hypothetical protein